MSGAGASGLWKVSKECESGRSRESDREPKMYWAISRQVRVKLRRRDRLVSRSGGWGNGLKAKIPFRGIYRPR